MNKAKEPKQSELYNQMSEDVDLINTSEMGKRLLKNIEKIVIDNKNDDKMMLQKAEEYLEDLGSVNP